MTEDLKIRILIDAINYARAYLVEPGTMTAANLLKILDAALDAASEN